MPKCLACAASISVAMALAGCAEPVWAPASAVARARHVAGAPPSLTLVTVVSTRNGSGAHSALLVNGSERVLFDPAGTFTLPFVPERNDVHFGMSDRAWAVYIDYHARETYDVRLQELQVTPAQAEAALRAAKAHGPAAKATCNLAVTRVLASVPGFEATPQRWFPKATANWFETLPGVTQKVITDDDADDNHGVLFTAAQPRRLESD